MILKDVIVGGIDGDDGSHIMIVATIIKATGQEEGYASRDQQTLGFIRGDVLVPSGKYPVSPAECTRVGKAYHILLQAMKDITKDQT